MPRGKTYDWPKVEAIFLSGKYKNLEEMSVGEKIPYDTLAQNSRKRKWKAKQKRVEAKVVEKIETKIINDTAERIMRMRDRHVRLGIMLQNKGFATLKDLPAITSEKDAIAAIRTGVGIEVEAILGKTVGAEGGAPMMSFQQNNIYQGMTDEQIAGTIAETLRVLEEAGALKSRDNQGNDTED
jgi:hypothetical protein